MQSLTTTAQRARSVQRPKHKHANHLEHDRCIPPNGQQETAGPIDRAARIRKNPPTGQQETAESADRVRGTGRDSKRKTRKRVPSCALTEWHRAQENVLERHMMRKRCCKHRQLVRVLASEMKRACEDASIGNKTDIVSLRGS